MPTRSKPKPSATAAHARSSTARGRNSPPESARARPWTAQIWVCGLPATTSWWVAGRGRRTNRVYAPPPRRRNLLEHLRERDRAQHARPRAESRQHDVLGDPLAQRGRVQVAVQERGDVAADA